MGSHHKRKKDILFINVWMLPKLLPKLRLPKLVELATPAIFLLTVMTRVNLYLRSGNFGNELI
jgi:hypothetical protein